MAFNRIVEVARQFSDPARIKAYHAEVARRELAKLLNQYPDDEKPDVTVYVDGVVGQPLESVGYPGVIRFDIGGASVLNRALRDALVLAKQFSPVGPGKTNPNTGKTIPHYRDAWFAFAGERQDEIKTVPRGVSEVTITNSQPYHRKLETKGGSFSIGGAGNSVLLRVEQALIRKYGKNIETDIRFVDLRNPYILKSTWLRKRLVIDGNPGQIKTVFSPPKKGRKAGDRMTYPALIIRAAFRG